MTTHLNPLPRGIIFVSYDPKQLSLINKLIGKLRESHFQIFWDQEIPPGANMQEALTTGLHLADVMVAVLSPEAVLSPQLLDQWNEFVLQRKPIIPVVYKPCDVPSIFNDYPVIEFEGDFHEFTERIASVLADAIR